MAAVSCESKRVWNWKVSISAASQKASGDGAQVPVVVLTHKSRTADLEAALDEIKASGVVSEAPVRLRMI